MSLRELLDPGYDETRALAEAWTRRSLDEERVTYLAATMLALVLVPAWIIVDFMLEQRWADTFLALRLCDVVLSLVVFLALKRARSLGAIRALCSLKLITTGAVIAFMLPRVSEYRGVYVMGFSLIFWGGAVMLRWPLKHTIITFGTILFIDLLSQFTTPTQVRTTQFAGETLYLASAALIGGMGAHIRRRLERRTFAFSFALTRKNEELAAAMTSLREAQVKLVESEKLSAIGRLLAGLSHEINNPLNVIHNNLHPLKDYLAAMEAVIEAGRETPAVQRASQQHDLDFVRKDFAETLGLMELATQRIRGIHDALRSYIRGGAPRLVEGALNEGLAATIAMLRRGLPPSVSIRAEYGELPPVLLQPGPMNQVFFNLIRNALEAVGSQGTVTVRSEALTDRVRISVSDSGPGVPEALRSRLFEPFFTTKDVGHGTGLGLAISYEIVRANGGALALDSTYVGGARFVVELPLRRPREREPSSRRSEQELELLTPAYPIMAAPRR